MRMRMDEMDEDEENYDMMTWVAFREALLIN